MSDQANDHSSFMTTAQPSSVLTSLFKYKAWANDELFALLRTVDEGKHATERHTCIRLLNHIYTVDQIFAAHLQRKKHAITATNTVETPTLDALTNGVAALDRWYVDFVASLDAAALTESIEFVFTDGKNARMSREEMLMHVITHGGYHRGAVGRILLQIEVSPPPDSLTTYLHRTEPTRRERIA
jgi:uncharacterized damage-inducible protein DinB